MTGGKRPLAGHAVKRRRLEEQDAEHLRSLLGTDQLGQVLLGHRQDGVTLTELGEVLGMTRQKVTTLVAYSPEFEPDPGRERMESHTVYVGDDLWSRATVKAEAEAEGLTVSDVIRHGIDLFNAGDLPGA